MTTPPPPGGGGGGGVPPPVGGVPPPVGGVPPPVGGVPPPVGGVPPPVGGVPPPVGGVPPPVGGVPPPAPPVEPPEPVEELDEELEELLLDELGPLLALASEKAVSAGTAYAATDTSPIRRKAARREIALSEFAFLVMVVSFSNAEDRDISIPTREATKKDRTIALQGASANC